MGKIEGVVACFERTVFDGNAKGVWVNGKGIQLNRVLCWHNQLIAQARGLRPKGCGAAAQHE